MRTVFLRHNFTNGNDYRVCMEHRVCYYGLSVLDAGNGDINVYIDVGLHYINRNLINIDIKSFYSELPEMGGRLFFWNPWMFSEYFAIKNNPVPICSRLSHFLSYIDWTNKVQGQIENGRTMPESTRMWYVHAVAQCFHKHHSQSGALPYCLTLYKSKLIMY